MRIWIRYFNTAFFLAFCILFTFQAEQAKSEENEVKYAIESIRSTLADSTLEYTIEGASIPAYTVSERFAPFRVVVDIAGGSFDTDFQQDTALLPENNFVSVKITDLKDQKPAIKRFTFLLAESHNYNVERNEQNLRITFSPASNMGHSTASSLPEARELSEFLIKSTPNSTTITIVSNGPIENYTVDTIGSGVNRPPRMFIDIEEVAINELVREKPVGTSVDKIRVASKGNGARIVFDSAQTELFRYTVAPSNEGLNIVIDETLYNSQQEQTNSSVSSTSTLDQLIDSSEELLSRDPEELAANSPAGKASALAEEFSFSGYKKQKISVDFYKIDIHNVFRLFRQITDLNIIVDEDVKGLLTLALTEVPWDFALDIVLNLMDLKKEERFNTIVIYPAKKEFLWPTRVEDNLSFKADLEVLEEEALVIEKSANQSHEITKAKEFIAQAQHLEKSGDFENASSKYIQALELWPENAAIPERLATLYLVNLGMNAKAVFFAKKSLQIDPANLNAALYAAIGSANMKRIAEAKEYFSQSISGNPPMREALISYAAFSENNNLNDAALKLLDKYHTYYGETLDTMIAKARILDKLGLENDATKQYRALLSSGFHLRSDLKRFIETRLEEEIQNF